MTTTTNHEEIIATALAALEELRLADICDAHELTRPFRQFAAQLNYISETLTSVGFAATIDDDVRHRVEDVLAGLSYASRLIETAARSALLPGQAAVAAGVRNWFEAVLTLPDLYSSLTSNDVLLGIEPTADEIGAQVVAELAGMREAIRRGDITINVPRKGE